MSYKTPKFQKRIEAIFEGFEVFLYRECPQGPSKRIKSLDDYRPWLEFDLRPLERKWEKEACHVPVPALNKLRKLLGTDDITVTGFDMGYNCRCGHESDTDYVGYVLAEGVKFPKGRL
jgi:hypothetical protein